MKRLLGFGLFVFLLVAHGCRQPNQPGTFSVEAKLAGAPAPDGGIVKLAPGEASKVDITVGYRRKAGAATKLKFKVQVESKGDLKVSPVGKSGWEINEDLGPDIAHLASTQSFLIDVPAPPAAGEEEIVVTITPEPGEQWRSTVKFKIGR